MPAQNRTRKLAGPTAGATTAVELYEVPANMTARVNKMTVLNTNATTARLLTVYLVPTGDSAADANALIKQVSIGAYDTLTVAEAIAHSLDAGDTIEFLQDVGTDLVAHLSGTEYLV